MIKLKKDIPASGIEVDQLNAAVELARVMTDNERLRQRVQELEAENNRLAELALKTLPSPVDGTIGQVVKDAERYRHLISIPAVQDELCFLFEIRGWTKKSIPDIQQQIAEAIDWDIKEGEPL